MNLAQYEGKKVIVYSTNGKKYSGVVDLYTPAKDNEIGEDAIAVSGPDIWFDESDIKSIEIVED